MLRLFFLLALSLGLFAAPARAQQPGGFPDILEDIFGGQMPSPGQGPYGSQSGMTYIENIPVQVTFDSRPDLLPPEATLVLTAIAPPPANVRRAKPLIMGETRILISRLAPPLSLVIAVPSDMAREVDYARIDAKIVDQNGNMAFRLENSVDYSGGQPPFLELIPIGASDAAPVMPVRKPGTGGPMAPYIRQNIDVIKAAIELPPGAQMSRGSTLVLHVTENDLAGGFGPSIVHEQRVDIDQKSAPFHVKLNVPTGKDNTLEQPELVAYIEDWAGRKTFVRARPVKIPASRNVVMRLDPILTGKDALPNASENFSPPPGVTLPISGTAEFDAYKGMPAGAKLVVTLHDARDYSNVIKREDLRLDGLSGYINFAFEVDAVEIKQRNPAPVLSAQIIDTSGQVLFTNRTSREVSTGKNIIRMTPTSAY